MASHLSRLCFHFLARVFGALYLLSPLDAWALDRTRLPMTNVVTDFAKDQDMAAQLFLLRPVTWGWIVAVLAVAAAVGFVWQVKPGSSNLPELFGTDVAEGVHRRWLVAVLTGVTALHLPGLWGNFNIYDDHSRIYGSKLIKSMNLENIGKLLLDNPGGDNMELMLLSFQLCWKLFGDQYWGWYAFNLVLFVGLLLLFERFVWRLVGHRLVALLSVALLGTSPIAAELLCWMSARCHLLGLFFTLGCLVSYLEYRRSTNRARWGWFALALVAFSMSQMCKPVFIYVPLWLLFFDLWEKRRDGLKLVAEKLPFVLLGALFLRKILEDADSVQRIRDDWLGGSLSNTLAQDANQLLEYLRASVLPLETGLRVPWNAASSWLAVDGVPGVVILGFAPLASLIILLGIVTIAITWGARRGFWLPTMVLCCSFTSFATVVNIPVHNTIFAYRYTLSARVMFVLLTSCLLVWGWNVLQRGRPAWRWLAVAVTASWFTLGAVALDANRSAWHDSVSFWSRNAELYPLDGWSHYYAGKAYQKAGKPGYALPHLFAAKRRLPGYKHVSRRLGDVHYALGFKKEAAKFYRMHFKGTQKISPFYRKRLRELDRIDSPE